MVYESKPAVDSEESDIVAAEGNEEYESGVLGGGWEESYGPPANQIKMASHIGVLRIYVSMSISVHVISAVSHGGFPSPPWTMCLHCPSSCTICTVSDHKKNTPSTCSSPPERSEPPIARGKGF